MGCNQISAVPGDAPKEVSPADEERPQAGTEHRISPENILQSYPTKCKQSSIVKIPSEKGISGCKSISTFKSIGNCDSDEIRDK